MLDITLPFVGILVVFFVIVVVVPYVYYLHLGNNASFLASMLPNCFPEKRSS